MPAFKERGYGVAIITYDAPEKLQRFADRHGKAAALLSDSNSETIEALGIRNTAFEEGSRAYGVPHPIVFVVDRNGVIKAKFFEEDYRVRPPAADILAGIDAMETASTD